uniref:RRM domain-containing protein n=1 Tax=Glossina austeni TaxID=7395 RepID=A0A1A9VLW5_GLOAU
MKKSRNDELKLDEGGKQLLQNGKITKKKEKLRKKPPQEVGANTLQQLSSLKVKNELLEAKKMHNSKKKINLKDLSKGEAGPGRKTSGDIEKKETGADKSNLSKGNYDDIALKNTIETKLRAEDGKSDNIVQKKSTNDKNGNLNAGGMKKFKKKKAKKLIKTEDSEGKLDDKNDKKMTIESPSINPAGMKKFRKKKVKKLPKTEANESKLDDIKDKKTAIDIRENLNADQIKLLEKKKAKKLAQRQKKELKKLQLKEQKPENVSPLNKPSGRDYASQPSNKIKNPNILNQKNVNMDKPLDQNDGEENKEANMINRMKPKSLIDIRVAKKQRKAEKREKLKIQIQEDKLLRDPAIEAATVFVGNLPVNAKRSQLLRLFKDYGPINSIRIRMANGQIWKNNKMRREAGSLNAYIVLKDNEAAERALSLNGTEFKGNHLRITRTDITDICKASTNAKRTVFVGNLKYSATENALREIFSSCGEIDYIRCLQGGEKGCKGVAYVCFKSPDAVGLALELDETMLDERPIHVERYNINKQQTAKEARATDIKNDSNQSAGKNRALKKPDDIKQKKNEFKGVKIDIAMKKKLKQKKKKPNDEMLKLAKKIAPIPKK